MIRHSPRPSPHPAICIAGASLVKLRSQFVLTNLDEVTVNVKDKVGAMIAAIENDPAIAHVTFRASTQLEEGLRCSARARNLPPIIVDEPHRIGGTDLGMNPVELLLCAVGTCQEIMYSVYASMLGIQLDELRVTCKGTLDLHGLFGIRDVPAGLAAIEFETHIKSPASRESIRELIDRAERNCPIMDTVTRPVRSIGKAYLNGEEIHASGKNRAI